MHRNTFGVSAYAKFSHGEIQLPLAWAGRGSPSEHLGCLGLAMELLVYPVWWGVPVSVRCWGVGTQDPLSVYIFPLSWIPQCQTALALGV